MPLTTIPPLSAASAVGFLLYTVPMSWSGRRKALIITVASILLLAAFAIFAFSIWYKTPTCTDGKQNQDEAGVDCGGECMRLCSFQVKQDPVVRFVRVLEPEPGSIDVIAYIDNGNTDAAARKAPFVLEVYDQNRRLIAEKTITIDLPESTTVPVYIADAAPQGSQAAQAFLAQDLGKTTWVRVNEGERVLPAVEDIVIEEGVKPRVTARLVNPLARPMRNVTLVATLFDPSGNAMAASQTVVLNLPAQGDSPVVFTWNAPFSAPVARVEILPVPSVSRAP